MFSGIKIYDSLRGRFRSSLFFLLLLILLSTYLASKRGWANSTISPKSNCASVIPEVTEDIAKCKLDKIFSEQYDSAAYVPNYCHSNVIRLFRAFKHKFPKVQSKDFNVLFITVPEYVPRLDPGAGFRVRRARAGYGAPGVTERFIKFTHHVVLEYKGRIYDFDNTDQALPQDSKEYLKEFFINLEVVQRLSHLSGSMPHSLIVYVIPGNEYLLRSTLETNLKGFTMHIFKTYQAQSLLEYVEKN